MCASSPLDSSGFVPARSASLSPASSSLSDDPPYENITSLFNQSVKPKYLELIPHLPDVLATFDQLSPEQKARIDYAAEAVRNGGVEPYFEDDSSLPRPLNISENDVYVAFIKGRKKDDPAEKKCDPLVGRGGSKKVYYTYGLRTGKLRILKSIKETKERIKKELAIEKAVGSTITIEGVVMRLSKKLDCDFEKGCIVERRFDCDLEKALKSEKINFNNPQVMITLLKQVAAEMVKVEDAGYVHRDIKLANFVIKFQKNDQFIIKIIDFGFTIPKAVEKPSFAGSRMLMAPEVINETKALRARHINKVTYLTDKADAWALGMDIIEFCAQKKIPLGIINNSPGLKVFVSKYMLLEGVPEDRLEEECRKRCPPMLGFLGSLQYYKGEWIKEPPKENILEYCLFNLLRVDVNLRWSARDLLEFLSEPTPAAEVGSSQ